VGDIYVYTQFAILKKIERSICQFEIALTKKKMSSTISHSIKQRKSANDVFITPLPLAKKQIDMIEYTDDDIWYDPFKNSGSYYNQFPNDNKIWAEILEDVDFFKEERNVDIICSNPPYSILNKVFEKSIELKPRVISYLIGVGNLTNKRIELMNENGYGLTKMFWTKVFKWYGMSCIVVFEKDKPNMEGFGYDRTVWREE
jgi:hypothetical protein